MYAGLYTIAGRYGLRGRDAGIKIAAGVSHAHIFSLIYDLRNLANKLKSAKLYEIGAGTSEVRRIVIGRAFNKEYANHTS